MFKFKKISILLLVVVLMLGLFSSFTIASAASLEGLPALPSGDYGENYVLYKNSYGVYMLYTGISSVTVKDSTITEHGSYTLTVQDVGSGSMYSASLGDSSWNRISSYSGGNHQYGYVVPGSESFIHAPCYIEFGSLVFFDPSWSGGSTEEQYCDGTGCPATDANHDGICDVCGLVLRLASIPEAPSILPDGGYGNNYALWVENGVYYALVDFTPSNSVVSVSGYGYRVDFTLTEPTASYRYDNGSWVFINDRPVGGSTFSIVQQSDLIHYPEALTFEGEDFFVPPLTLETAVKGGIADLLQTMMKALTILVGLGVLLMASLIGLDLFGKVLRRFLG